MRTTRKIMTALLATVMVLAFAAVGTASSDPVDADNDECSFIKNGSQNTGSLSSALSSGGADQNTTVTMLKDVTYSTGLTVGNAGPITLDFNGKTLTGHVTVGTGCTLTMMDGGSSPGKIDASADNNHAITNNGTLTVKDITVEKKTYNYMFLNTGTLSIESGTFSYPETTGTGSMVRGSGSTPSTITINGGTFTYGGANALLMTGDYSTIIVNGGTFNVTNDAPNLICNWNVFTINGGTFNYSSTSGGQICYANDVDGRSSNLTINGGQFSSGGLTVYKGFAQSAGRVHDGAYLVFGSNFSMNGFTYDSAWYEVKDNKLSRLDAEGTAGTGTINILNGNIDPTFTVSFDSNGGSPVASQDVKYLDKVVKPADPTRDDYFFSGWYTDAGLKQAYDFDTAVSSSFTLYAKWTDVSIEEKEEPYVDEDGNEGVKITEKATYTDGSTEETEIIAVNVDDEVKITESTVFTDADGNVVKTATEGSIASTGASIEIMSGSADAAAVSIAMAEVISKAAEKADFFVLDLTVSTPAIAIPNSLLVDSNISSVTVAVNSDAECSARITIPTGALSLDSEYDAVAFAVTSSTGSAPANAKAVFQLEIEGAASTFSGPVIVSYDIDLPEGTTGIKAYCIDTKEYIDAMYVNGTVTFALRHFSSWAIVADSASHVDDSDEQWYWDNVINKDRTPENVTTSGDSAEEEAAVIIAAAAVAGAMLACAFFAFRRP